MSLAEVLGTKRATLTVYGKPVSQPLTTKPTTTITAKSIASPSGGTPFIVGSPVSTLISKTTTVKTSALASPNAVTIVNKATGDVSTGIAIPTSNLTSKQQEAINQASRLKQTAWYNANPTVQKNLTKLRTLAVVGTLKAQGNVIVPASALPPGVPLPSIGEQYTALQGTVAQQQAQLSDYYTRLSGYMSELQRGTVELGNTKASLSNLESMYQSLLDRYNALVNNPPQQGFQFPDIGGWLQKNALWIGLGFVGIMALLIVPKFFGGRK